MSKLVAVLVITIIVLIAAVAFLLGQRSSHPNAAPPAVPRPPASAPPPNASAPKPVTPEQRQPASSVTVGLAGAELDACGSNGRVIGLDPTGDNFLAVKSAPSLSARRIDKVGPGAELYICQTSADGKWLGVVYEAGGQLSARCGVTSPVTPPQRYAGPCQSGWVYSKYVDVYAG